MKDSPDPWNDRSLWGEFKELADEQRKAWEENIDQPLIWFSTRDYTKWFFCHLPSVLSWIAAGALEENDDRRLVWTEEFDAIMR